jgi:hypothetical protein
MIGSGGYVFAFSDAKVGGPSTACVNSTMFCGKGTIGMANPPSYSYYGGGIGVNLSQPSGSMGLGAPFAATGTGISYAISSFPTVGTGGAVRLIIDNGATAGANGADYCAAITTATGMVPWSMFFTQCYNLPGGDAGAGLSGPPTTASHVQFQVASGMTAGSFDFCVTSLKFM